MKQLLIILTLAISMPTFSCDVADIDTPEDFEAFQDCINKQEN